jgi:hypothetical protein
MAHRVEILTGTTPVTTLPVLAPINKEGDFLSYGDRLSNVGTAKFRVATREPLFTRFGDILQPWANHVRIYDGNRLAWQGVIVDNPTRNTKYIEVLAKTYEVYLTKKRIVHDAEVVAGDGKNDYKTFSTGTLASAVTTLINDVKAKAGTNSLLQGLTIGTVENPNFPAGFTKADGTPLTGGWTFSNDMTLQFSYVDTLKVLQQLGIYSECDFKLVLTNGVLNFHWKTNYGTNRPEIVFEYGQYGAIRDFNSPRYGSKMANTIMGIAADNNGNILHVEKSLESSVQTYGSLEDVAAFMDVKDKNALLSRIVQELPITGVPDAELLLELNERAAPLGLYDVGDRITAKIVLGPINTTQLRRVVGYDVTVGTTGNKKTHLLTNKPKV